MCENCLKIILRSSVNLTLGTTDLFHGDECLSGLFAHFVDGAERAGAERLTDGVVGD